MVASSRELVERARERAGCSDLGIDGWQEGLDQLLRAVPVDLGENPEAVAAIEAICVGRLVHRLRIERWYSEHGKEAAQPVEGPVVVLGLPRSGTTALHYFLALDPQFRYQRTWEVLDPVPPPELASESEDPRRLAMPARNDVRHISSIDGPIEDVMVLGLHFHNQEHGLPLPTYTRWWRGSDLRSTFAYHERVLRMLHSRRPPTRWLLKAPLFIFFAEQLAAHYPGARFLMTHRDPVATLPSTCSTVLAAAGQALPAYTATDPIALGREILEHYAEGARRILTARETLGEERFLDVGQGDFERDPLATAERIYDFLGLELREETREAMQQWAHENRRGARGEHRYTLEEYGYSVDAVRKAFSAYIERFGGLLQS